ncbi:hypothetical protein COEREDRAFT_12518 [Coemansia reversa NRRL 1564]|uniref:Uncharacterized protein n=1 Tax=Coemansia reversa (strain ATCC 12441 / NRRL 1564) TaxID=763665 RepID=A0A2G5B0S0_COERN|nr:hypothetical protein COEREDRAFT_12518 [Coemansia reversa NRRL 1564]|eukprot:PIA12618.1 hypothetical protein COEREDRAFT_12518 [Coemansia reversa NRRL 1564]
MLPMEWKIINRRTATITVEELTAAVVRQNKIFLVDPEMTPKPFGAMVKSKTTSYSTINVQVEQPSNKVVKPLTPNPIPTSLNILKPGKTVFDYKQPWDLLLSNAHLKLLHIQPMTPAIIKQLKQKESPIPKKGDTVAVDRDLTPEDTVPDLPSPKLMMPTDQDYAELSEAVMITGANPNSEPIPELSTDLEL